MSDQDLDYAGIRRSVETGLQRQKQVYRRIFFAMHLLFYLITMFAVWGTLTTDLHVRELIFGRGSAAPIVVILPTLLWSSVILFHVASLFVESGMGDNSIRQRLLMREAGEEILRKGLVDDGMLEKPKRRASAVERMRLSDDGEQLVLDEDEALDERDQRIVN